MLIKISNACLVMLAWVPSTTQGNLSYAWFRLLTRTKCRVYSQSVYVI